MNEESKKEKKKKKKNRKDITDKDTNVSGKKKKDKKKKQIEESDTEPESEPQSEPDPGTEEETQDETEWTVLPTKENSKRSSKTFSSNSSKKGSKNKISQNERRTSVEQALEEENLILRRSLNQVSRLLEPDSNEEMRQRRSSQFRIYEAVDCCPPEQPCRPPPPMDYPIPQPSFMCPDMTSINNKVDQYLSQIKMYRITLVVMIGLMALATVAFIMNTGRFNQGCEVAKQKKADENLPHYKGQAKNGQVNYRGRGQKERAYVGRDQGGRSNNRRNQNRRY